MTTGGPSRSEVYEQLKTVLMKEFGFGESQLGLDAHLVNDLDLDSIDWIDMAVALEQRTGHELKEEEMASIRTVADVVDAVHRKLQPDAV
ncbi:MAG: acyl carrier protein [Candidatus Rokuibacteriota bacterium]